VDAKWPLFSYFWLYYAVSPATGLIEVPVGQLAGPNECHGILDPAEDMDADSIPGSNSTYTFAGIDASKPEMLMTRTYFCAEPACRASSSIHCEHTHCSHADATGRWQQHTIHEAANIAKKKAVQKVATKVFALGVKQDHLYAAFGSYVERGGRPYWLLRTTSTPWQAKKAIKTVGRTIAKDNWVVKARWYLCTSDTQDRKSYKLLDGETHVALASMVQEHGLEFVREHAHEPILSDASHVAIMSHNFSNVDK